MTGEKRIAAAALLVSVFVSGVVGGVAGVKLVDPDPALPSWMDGFEGRPRVRPPWVPEGDSIRMPKEFSVRILGDRLSRDLGLSDGQRAQIVEMVEARQERVSALMQDMAGPMRAQFDSMNAEIRLLLTPTQREAFDQFLEWEDAFLGGRADGFRRGGRPPGGWPPQGDGSSPGHPPLDGGRPGSAPTPSP